MAWVVLRLVSVAVAAVGVVEEDSLVVVMGAVSMMAFWSEVEADLSGTPREQCL